MKYKDRIIGLIRIRGDRILPNPLNWRTHPDEQRSAMRGVLADIGVAGSLKAVPADEAKIREALALKGAEREKWLRAFEASAADVLLLDGHLRAEEIRDQPVAVELLDLLPAEQAEFLATFDPIGALAGRNAAKLDETLKKFNSTNADVQALVAKIRADGEAALAGFGDGPPAGGDGSGAGGGEDQGGPSGAGSLAERFGVPPFSVLNAREGWWQARKAAWIALGLCSELGRGGQAGSKLTMSATVQALKPSADQALKHARSRAAE